MAKYKTHSQGTGRTTKSVHLYIDIDLWPIVEQQENKTRFVNDAIRAYLKNF